MKESSFFRTLFPRSLQLLLVSCLLFFVSQPTWGQTNLEIDATTLRSTGGVATLDRAVYFNHWGHFNTNTALDQLVTSINGFNSFTGRETFELDTFIAQGLGEDPGNPGFFIPSNLTNEIQTDFRNFALNSNRWSSLRNHPNPIFVQSGRATPNWPAFTLPTSGATLPVADGGAAYAQLLTAYAEEVLYGSGPSQGFLPFDPDRNYLEIMNEPQLELNKPSNGTVTWQQVIDMHRTVTETVKAAFPQVNIGGASVGDNLVGPHRWSLMRAMMEDMVNWNAEFDFWSVHLYECYQVTTAQQPFQLTHHSPAHLNGLMDLFEATSNRLFGDSKQFAVTEYGSWSFTSLDTGGGFNGSGQNFGSYTRDERQWDVARDTKEKLMEFLRRPDRIINATPFIGIQHFTSSSPSEEEGYYNFFDRLANGSYVETILGGLYRLYNDVNGDFVMVEKDNVDTQAIAVLDGNQIHVMLNNMQQSNNAVSINLTTGSSNVVSASLNRLYFNGTQGVYEDGIDVTTSWQTITMLPNEGAVLTLTLDSPVATNGTREAETFYATQTEQPIPFNGLAGPFDLPNVTTTDIQTATFRVSYSRTSAPQGEPFTFFINGASSFPVPSTGNIGFDENDTQITSREIEIPVASLQEGDNQVFVSFQSGGGQVLAVTLEATFQEVPFLLGDCNLDGVVDFLDIAPLIALLSGGDFLPQGDCNQDGTINFLDIAPFIAILTAG